MKLFIGPSARLYVPLQSGPTRAARDCSFEDFSIVSGEVKVGYWFEVIGTDGSTNQRLVKYKATREEIQTAIAFGGDYVYRP